MTKTRRTYADLVRSFDHSELATLPEYGRAVKALDTLIHAINRADLSLTLDDWLATVRDMTVALPFHDCCHDGCDQSTPAYAFRVKDGWVTAAYACPCGRRWTCGWSASAPDYW